MRLPIILAIFFSLSWSLCSSAQDVAPQISEQPLASEAIVPPVVARQPRKIGFFKDWIYMPQDMANDQKRIWTFPVSVARGRHLKPTMAVLGVTAAMVLALDVHPANYFRTTTSFRAFNKVFGGNHTARANYVIPVSLFGFGLARRDRYAQKTFIQAGEAVLDSELLTTVMKDLDRRWNPLDSKPKNDYVHTWFKYPPTQHTIVGNGSMPSGHTITAFAVATVYADRYSKHRWVKWVAYGLASVDGFSRVSEQSHFSSDVFVGAVLGYTIAHNVVRANHH